MYFLATPIFPEILFELQMKMTIISFFQRLHYFRQKEKKNYYNYYKNCRHYKIKISFIFESSELQVHLKFRKIL